MFAEEHGGQMAGVGGARGRTLEEEVRDRMEGGNTQVTAARGRAWALPPSEMGSRRVEEQCKQTRQMHRE